MPNRFSEALDGTPCPVRSVLPPQHAGFDSFDADDDDTAELDFTRAIQPDDIRGFRLKIPPERRGLGLKEPPRRVTAHVPAAKPAARAAAPAPAAAPQATAAPPHRLSNERRSNERKSAEEAVIEGIAAALEPKGLHQQPVRRPTLARGGLGAAPGQRRRVSTILRERAKQRQPQEQDQENICELPTTEEGQPKRMALGDKTTSAKNQQYIRQIGVEKKQLKAPPKRAPITISQKEGEKEKEQTKRRSGKENPPPLHNRTEIEKPTFLRKKEPIVKTSGPARKKSPPPRKALEKNPNFPFRGKRGVDSLLDDEDSFSSQSGSDFESSFSRKGSGLRLVKRQKTSVGSLPSPPSLTAAEEAEIVPPETDGLLPTSLSFPQKPARKPPKPLDPLLDEDLTRCEMYEEMWLAAQESSVSQLLNDLLAQYSPAPTGKSRIEVRKELLKLYSAAPFPLLYNRVHASLLYGALSITPKLLEKSSTAKFGRTLSNTTAGEHAGWGADIGMKERFMNIFIDTYDQKCLICALEVVVGREMFALSQPGDSEKRVLEGYLERYIIRSEDILASATAQELQKKKNAAKFNAHSAEDEDRGTPAWFLRRTLLRSFMLVILLDKAKSRGILGRQCLFKKASRHKASISVLQALSRLLLPFMGDASKPLSHLNYSLEVEQMPLAEFDYGITNLAVDMRDGIRLTRLVEVFLKKNRSINSSPSQRGTWTLDTNDAEEDWPLTPHLHYPIMSRAQRMHNVSLALNALHDATASLEDVNAKDIVDGYRERSLGLLWSLVSRWGLDMLVDWDAVKKEIYRLNLTSAPRDRMATAFLDKKSSAELLELWAVSVARRAGVTVKNLTTSFGDGRVFTAIVKEYEQYLPSQARCSTDASLEMKLKAVGCNSYFAGLFAAGGGASRVYNQDFVISGLAYLCSRIMQPSFNQRAAMTIQRAYRRHSSRIMMRRRIMLLLLAHDCAYVVNGRNRVVSAAITIQRAFRAHYHRIVERLIQATIGIESAARGFLARRDFQQQRKAAKSVQRRWRSIREARYQERMGVAKHAVIGFQAKARGILQRKALARLHDAVRVTEAQWEAIIRGRQARTTFLETRNATATIQRCWKLARATRDDRRVFQQTRRSVVSLQAIFRGAAVRRGLATQGLAVTILQSWWRVTLKARTIRNSFVRLCAAAQLIQRRRRNTVAARVTRQQFLKLAATVALIKTRFFGKKRVLAAALTVQRAWRTVAPILRLRKIQAQIILIQSAWRGFLVRRDGAAIPPRIKVARKRLARITVRAESTLGVRTRRALELVAAKPSFARGVQQLDAASRYSRECALLVAGDEPALAAVLAWLDANAAQAARSTGTGMAARTLAAAVGVLRNVAAAPAAVGVLVRRAGPAKKADDAPAVLVGVLEAAKGAPAKSALAECLLAALECVQRLLEHAEMRRRLMARRKWCEAAAAAVKNVLEEARPKRRGAVEDVARAKAAGEVLRLLEA